MNNFLMTLEGRLLKAVSPFSYELAHRALGPVSNKFFSILHLKSLNCEKIKIPRKDKSEMRVCIMRGKKTQGKTVGILWLHGGGYTLGGPEMAIMSFPRQLLNNCNCVIVVPDYTLSTIKPFPAAVDDAYSALMWMKENREKLKIDCEKLVVGGESAGGGLTAGLCMLARDRGEDCIGLQLPLYPMLDDRVTSTSAENKAPVWDTKSNKAAWRIYLGDKVMNNSVSKYAAPARETNLKGLPPAISVIGTAEPFYEETLTFFKKLNEAGVKTELKEYEGAYHAFDMMAPYEKISKDANIFLIDNYLSFVEKHIK